MRSFRLAACRSCAGVICNRSIAAQLGRPHRNATEYFPTRPRVRKPNPRLMSPIPSACRRTPYGSNACDCDPIQWLTSMLMMCRAATGAVTRPRRARGLTTRTSFGTPVTPGGARLLQRGSPPPPPMTDPTGLWFVGLRPQRQPHPEFGYRYGCRPNAHAAQAGLPGYRPCGLRGHAAHGNALWGQPVSADGASGWRRCCAMKTNANSHGSARRERRKPVPAVGRLASETGFGQRLLLEKWLAALLCKRAAHDNSARRAIYEPVPAVTQAKECSRVQPAVFISLGRARR